MRIQRLEVEGFRSLKKVSWEPGALNVVIGPNGSGKSNLLMIFEILNKASKGVLRDTLEHSIGLNSVFWDGDYPHFCINISMTDTSAFDFEYANKNYSFSISNVGFLGSYIVSAEKITSHDDNNSTDRHLSMNRTQKEVTYRQGTELTTKPTSETLSDYELFLSLASSAIVADLETYSIRNFFVTTLLVKHIDTSHDTKMRLPTSVSLERTLKSDGSNLIQVLHTLYTSDRNFESDIDSAMNAAFGNDYEKLVFPPAADQRVQLRIRWKSLKREQSALDISDGTLRFLYLLAILANPDPSPLIAIDEPETGLHPSMFPIIAEFAAEASRKSQIIFTTHSDQFLTACGEFNPTITVASWSEGETHLKIVNQDELQKWLKHYSLGSLFRSGELEQLL